MSHAWRYCCTYTVDSDGGSSDHLTCECGAEWWQGEDGEPLGPCECTAILEYVKERMEASVREALAASPRVPW